MITAITGLAPEWYTPKSQLDAEEPTRFKLKPLDQLTFLEVVSLSSINADDMLIPSAAARRIILKNGLVDWENLIGVDGKPIDYSPIVVKTIPFSELTGICNKIVEISAPGEETIKN